MRMTASWSGSKRTDRIQVCGAKMRPMASSPRIVTQTCAVRRRTSKREAHLAVHRPSACSGVKALRNTSDAKAASRQAPLAFRSLDPFRALREPDRRRRDEERPSRSEQRTGSKTQNNRLTGKAPYKSGTNRTPSLRGRRSIHQLDRYRRDIRVAQNDGSLNKSKHDRHRIVAISFPAGEFIAGDVIQLTVSRNSAR